jgi:hypothetical protein
VNTKEWRKAKPVEIKNKRNTSLNSPNLLLLVSHKAVACRITQAISAMGFKSTFGKKMGKINELRYSLSTIDSFTTIGMIPMIYQMKTLKYIFFFLIEKEKKEKEEKKLSGI